jgi:type VI secretion system secreted protein VgrG
VFRFARTGQDGGTHFYEAVLGPWTDFLRERVNCRVFREPDLQALLLALWADHGNLANVRLAFDGAAHPIQPPVVQYMESDFDFMSRLLEDQGIFYRFEAGPQGHVLVLADDSTAAGPLPDLTYLPSAPLARDRVLEEWQWQEQVVSSSHALKAFDSARPDAPLSASPSFSPLPGVPALERYEYAGAESYGDTERGEALARIRGEAQRAGHGLCAGAARCRSLAPGGALRILEGEPAGPDRLCRAFFVTEVFHEGANNYQAGEDPYRNRFVGMPLDQPYRPPRATPRPRMGGPQTGIVVTGEGKDIDCDGQGRIKVRYHWDRSPEADQGILMRVASPLAGPGYGFQSLPRKGQEVVVDFLDGNPDRPLVTGCVPNGLNQPAWIPDPGHAGIGFQTRSTHGSGPKDSPPPLPPPPAGWKARIPDANLLRLEDQQGREEIHVQAQRDLCVLVNQDEYREVVRNRVRKVGGDEAVHVLGSRHEKVDGNLKTDVGLCRIQSTGILSHETATVKTTDVATVSHRYTFMAELNGVGLYRLETVGRDYVLEVGRDLIVEAKQSIHLKVGHDGSELFMDADGNILLKGRQIKLESSGALHALGSTVDLNPTQPLAVTIPPVTSKAKAFKICSRLEASAAMEFAAAAAEAVVDEHAPPGSEDASAWGAVRGSIPAAVMVARCGMAGGSVGLALTAAVQVAQATGRIKELARAHGERKEKEEGEPAHGLEALDTREGGSTGTAEGPGPAKEGRWLPPGSAAGSSGGIPGPHPIGGPEHSG